MLWNLALTVNAQGRVEEAEKLLLDFAELHGDSAEVWVNVARFHSAQGNPGSLEKASSILIRALLKSPEYPPALAALYAVRLQQGDRYAALAVCERYLKQAPDDAEMLYHKANLLMEAGKSQDDALAAINRALELDERNEFLVTRGLIYRLQSEYAKALDDLLPAVREMTSPPAQLEVAIAEAYLETGKRNLAQQYYDSAKQKIERGESVDATRWKALKEHLTDGGA